MAILDPSEQPAHLVPFPYGAALQPRQGHASAVDVIEDGGDFHVWGTGRCFRVNLWVLLFFPKNPAQNSIFLTPRRKGRQGLPRQSPEYWVSSRPEISSRPLPIVRLFVDKSDSKLIRIE